MEDRQDEGGDRHSGQKSEDETVGDETVGDDSYSEDETVDDPKDETYAGSDTEATSADTDEVLYYPPPRTTTRSWLRS